MARPVSRWRRLFRTCVTLAALCLSVSFVLYNGVLTVHLADVTWTTPGTPGCRGVGLGPDAVITPGGTFRYGSLVREELHLQNFGTVACTVTNLTLWLGGAWPLVSSNVPVRAFPGQSVTLSLDFVVPSHSFDQPAVVAYSTLDGPVHHAGASSAAGVP